MKVLLITHKPDIDGITPIILSKFVFEDIDYITLETHETNPTLRDYIENKKFDSYDKIFITDLSVNKDICDLINANDVLKNKLLIFDHHNSHLFVNDYSFGTVISIDLNGCMQCGTSLYYEYLLKEYYDKKIDKTSIREFIELVRQYDTWEWFTKYNNVKAKYLTNLFEIYGTEYFINYYYEFLLNNDNFEYTNKEMHLLQIEENRINRYVEEKSNEIISVKLLGYSVGIVYAENYRSILGNTLARKYKDEYDFIILINLSRGISYRGIKDIDLGQVASIFGGKGHINSSGSPIDKIIKKEIIKLIFKDKVEFNN